MALSNPPSFIKILHDHDAPYMALPHDFVTKHMANKIPKDVVIRSANGGFLWNVKVKKIGESVCFDEGWSKVVKDAHLGYEDILVLWLVGESTFKMWIYGPMNGCEKILLSQTKHVKLDDDVVFYADDDGVGIGDDGYPFFTVTTTSTLYKEDWELWMPTKFVELAGIRRKKGLKLKDLDGSERGVLLIHTDYHLLMGISTSSMSWLHFVVSNNISQGDKCVFKYNTREDKLCLAKVTK